MKNWKEQIAIELGKFCGNKGYDECLKFISTILKDKELKIPTGVSQWREYGKKYGYWDYFKEQELSNIVKEMIGKEKDTKDKANNLAGNPVEWNIARTGYNTKRQELIDIAKKHGIKINNK